MYLFQKFVNSIKSEYL